LVAFENVTSLFEAIPCQKLVMYVQKRLN